MKTVKIKPDRINFYDNLRFILILLVVIGHFVDTKYSESSDFQSIFACIYSFHMPLFLFLSGLFHGNKNILQKVMTYISIGFMLKIVSLLLSLILSDDTSFSFLSGSAIPWYMFVLAIYISISYAFRNMDKKFLLLFSIMLGCFVGYDASIGDFLYLSRAIVFYPFFLLGIIIGKDRIMQITRNKWLKPVSFVVLLIWVLLCIFQIDYISNFRPLFTGRNPFAVNPLFAKWGFVYRILCYFIACLIGLCVICITPNKRLPIITLLGGRTLQIYFWHKPVVMVLIKYQIDTQLCMTSKGKAIWLLCAVICTLVLGLKLFSFPVAQMKRSCKYSKSLSTDV